MCQLLGLNSALPTDAVFAFTGFVPRGGQTDHHVDGFGMGFFEGSTCTVFVDEQAAMTSPVAAMVQRTPFPSLNTIAHVRKATQGEVNIKNSHPFVRSLWGQDWLFAHNGNLVDFEPVLNGPFLPRGTTDSERAFCAMLNDLHQRFGDVDPGVEVWFPVLAKIVGKIAAHGPFNLLLSNGDVMVAHCSTRLFRVTRAWPFAQAHLIDVPVGIDFAHHTGPDDRITVVATAPLTHDEVWTPFQTGELVLLRDGAVHAHTNTTEVTLRTMDERSCHLPLAKAA